MLSDGQFALLLFGVVVIVRRWHFYRYVRPYMPVFVVAGCVHYLYSGKIEHGIGYDVLCEELSILDSVNAWFVTFSPIIAFDIRAVIKDLVVLVGVYHLCNYCTQVYNWVREMVPMGLHHFIKYCTDIAYEAIKEFPVVQDKVDEEKTKFIATIDADIKSKARVIDGGSMNYELPQTGMDQSHVLNIMKSCTQKEDEIWEKGKVSGGIYHGDRDHINFLNEAFNQYSISNPLHTDIWPSMLKYESEIISMTASLVNGGHESVCGCTTSGGTESIILAIKAHRDYYRRKANITAPEMIACTSAHAAVDKACELLNIKLIKVPMRPKTYEIDVQRVVEAITCNTVLIYSSAPSFPQGVIDPITELGAIASYYEVGLHVDGCLGGFVLPFAKRLGYDIPDFDFGVKGVTSMSLDTHKYGYALKGTSVVLYRNSNYRAAQYFLYPEWPGGFYTTATLAGSRSGGMIAQTWASMVTVGMDGYMEYARGIMDTAKIIAKGIEDTMPELLCIGGTHAMVVCIAGNPDVRVKGEVVNIHSIGDAMSKKGWSLNSLQLPASVHLCCTVRHIGRHDLFLRELRECLDEQKRLMMEVDPMDRRLHGNAAVYGLASSMPPGPVKELLTTYNNCMMDKL